MSDPYNPKISSFKYSKIETKATRWALGKEKPWDVDKLKKADLTEKEKEYVDAIVQLKDRIKIFHLQRQNNCCCYCATNFKARDIEQDREHIIPKSKESCYTYSIFNLAVACKYCNLTIKGKKTQHLRGYRRNGLANKNIILNEMNYNFVHPNVHDWGFHINLDLHQTNRTVNILHYRPKTKRGKFTYHFFRLNQLEIFNNTERQRKSLKGNPEHPGVIEIRIKNRQ